MVTKVSSLFVSNFVDCAEGFDAEVVLSLSITLLFARYLWKISPGVYTRAAIADNTAEYSLHAFTLKREPSVRVTPPDVFTYLK